MLPLRPRVLIVFAVLFLAAPVRADSFDHAGLAKQVLEQHIRPGYANLEEKAKALHGRTVAFCSGDSSKDIERLRDAFRDMVFAWSAVSHIRFGPVMDEHRHPRMLYWPDRKGLGFRQIRQALRNKSKSVTSLNSLTEKSVALQGLSAIELLLYWDVETQLLAPGERRTHRCGYLTAASENLAMIANAVVNGWAPGADFTAIFLEPGKDNPRYLEPSEVTLEIVKAFVVGLERLRDIKVAGPLGLRPNNPARVVVPFEPSKLSMRAIQAELEGLIDLFEKGGLKSRIEKQESGMGDAISLDLAQALKSFERIQLPIKEAAKNTEAENELIATGFPLKNAREQATRVLSEAAGLSMGFNALDGD